MLLFGKPKKNKDLDRCLEDLQRDMSNNYKDAAQEDLKKFDALRKELETSGALNEKQREYYEEQFTSYQTRLAKYTHKDQKVGW